MRPEDCKYAGDNQEREQNQRNDRANGHARAGILIEGMAHVVALSKRPIVE
jgi:hypothetical protein